MQGIGHIFERLFISSQKFFILSFCGIWVTFSDLPLAPFQNLGLVLWWILILRATALTLAITNHASKPTFPSAQKSQKTLY